VLALGQDLPAESIDKLTMLVGELTRWNKRINLTAIRDPDAMVSGHILDSLAVRSLLEGRPPGTRRRDRRRISRIAISDRRTADRIRAS
jgi:16S rRNA G527 N7-methylase RsmG